MNNKKVTRLLAAVFILLLYSCETQPDVPLIASEVVATSTTTTTVRAPVMIISQAPATTTTTTTVAPPPKPKLPSISEPEYRNLFATVNDSFQDILFHEIDVLLPEAFTQASAQFQNAKMHYEIQIWRWPYDGEAAYPFAGDLRNSGIILKGIFEKGLPLRSDAEKLKAEALANLSRSEGIPATAAKRLAKAKDEFAQGIDANTRAEYRSSIASFRRAILLYQSADERAQAESLKSKVEASGYGRYSPYHSAEATRFLQEDEALSALSGSDAVAANKALARGTELLQKASRSYEYILAWGAEREALEARDKALIARQGADWLHSDINAPEEYSDAALKLSDAEGRQESGHFNEATALYGEAASGFEIARLTAGNREYAAKATLEAAEQAVKAQSVKLKVQGYEKDENFLEAESLLAKADDALLTANFEASRMDSLEALNQVAISESRLQAQISAREEADRLAIEARLRSAEENAAALATQLAAKAAELAAKTAELEALRAASALREAEMQAQAERDAAEKALLERQAAAARAEASRLEAERLAQEASRREMAQREEAAQLAEQAAAEQLEASERLASEKAAAAREAINAANQRYSWAVSKNAMNNYPEALAAGSEAIAAAIAALESGKTETASAQAESALAILSGIKEYADLPAAYIVDLLPERKNIDSLSSIAAAEYGYNDLNKWSILYEANKAELRDPSNPNLLLSGQVIVIPSIRGETRSGTWDPKKTYPRFEKRESTETEARSALDKAKAAIDQARTAYTAAVARNARNNYPESLAQGLRDLEASRRAYDSGDSLTAASKATSANAVFESIREFAPLPAKYKIGLMPARRDIDSLWGIAASSFGYSDPYKWTILYQANKATLPDPSNPNLLLPGQLIVIPSVSGERREGLWDPKKTYPSFGKR